MDLISSEFLSALIGAFIGGAFTILATLQAHKMQQRTQRNIDYALLYDTINLIHVELTTAFNVYMNEYGTELLEIPDNEPYIAVFPIGENSFCIYDSSPACLSRLEPELSGLIVRWYMRAKGLVKMIEMNNENTEAAHRAAEAAYTRRATEQDTTTTEAQFDADVMTIAKMKKMGYIADAMKLVTAELLQTTSITSALINNLKRPIR